MISTVFCGRFYLIFVSPMLHKNPSQISLRGIFRILYPKKYPIFSKILRKKILAARHSFKKECSVLSRY